MRAAAAFCIVLAAGPSAFGQEEVDKYENSIQVAPDPSFAPGPGMTPDEYAAFKFVAVGPGQAPIEPPDFEIIEPIGPPTGPLIDPKVDGYRIHWSTALPTGDLRSWAGLETTFQQEWVGAPKDPGQVETFVVASDLMPANSLICVAVEFLYNSKWSKLSAIVAPVGADPGKGCGRTAADGADPGPVTGLSIASLAASTAIVEYRAADEDNSTGGRCSSTIVKSYPLGSNEPDPTALTLQTDIDAWAAAHGTELAAGVEAPALPTILQAVTVDGEAGQTTIVSVRMRDNGGRTGPAKLTKFSVAAETPGTPGDEGNDACAGSASSSAGLLLLSVLLPLVLRRS